MHIDAARERTLIVSQFIGTSSSHPTSAGSSLRAANVEIASILSAIEAVPDSSDSMKVFRPPLNFLAQVQDVGIHRPVADVSGRLPGGLNQLRAAKTVARG
jgi:hypothetical protein